MFDQIIVVSSTALLHLASAYRNNNQTRSCLGRVCAMGMFHCIRHVEFPKFLLNDKKMYLINKIMHTLLYRNVISSYLVFVIVL